LEERVWVEGFVWMEAMFFEGRGRLGGRCMVRGGGKET